jgi:hypothetical protein
LRFLPLQRIAVRVALSASCRLRGRSRFGVCHRPAHPSCEGKPMRHPCGFSLPVLLEVRSWACDD